MGVGKNRTDRCGGKNAGADSAASSLMKRRSVHTMFHLKCLHIFIELNGGKNGVIISDGIGPSWPAWSFRMSFTSQRELGLHNGRVVSKTDSAVQSSIHRRYGNGLNRFQWGSILR